MRKQRGHGTAPFFGLVLGILALGSGVAFVLLGLYLIMLGWNTLT